MFLNSWCQTNWISYLKWLFISLFCGLAICAIFIIIANPYRNLPFDGLNNRPMIEINQRFMYPPLARDTQFNSAIFGTSTSRLLQPLILNNLFNARFAQLSMNSGTAYEQSRLLDLFIRHHPNTKNILIGLDVVWCTTNANYPKFTKRQFPEWMYDENPWNDLLYFFNGKSLELSTRILSHYLGLENTRYNSDGYKNFLPTNDDYNKQKVLQNLYGSDQPKPIKFWQFSENELSEYQFPVHNLMSEILNKVSNQTNIILFFVPYHAYHVFGDTKKATAQRYQACKSKIVQITADKKNVAVYDFMFPSDITKNDLHYWDPLHYRIELADNLAEMIYHGQQGKNHKNMKILKP